MFGNVGNSHFGIAQALQLEGSVDAHLYVADRELVRPDSDRRDLAEEQPDWLHVGHWLTRSAVLRPSHAPITEELSRYDLVIASHNAPPFAAHSGARWSFYATGADLTVRPFPWTFRHRRGSAASQAAHAYLSMQQRWALRRADALWMQPFAPFRDAVTRLNIDPRRVNDAYFPLAIDSELFRPRVGLDRLSTALVDTLRGSDFIVFHPTRLVLDDSPAMRRSGQWKGNDTLVRGFAEYLLHATAKRPLLVLPEWQASEDVPAVKSLIEQLGIVDRVHWAVPPRTTGFTREELVAVYDACDVAADDFGVGWFGYVSLEAMSCSKPVISKLDRAVVDRLYGTHPWCHAETPGDVARQLLELENNPARRQQLGEAGRALVLRHHSLQAVQRAYVSAVEDVLDQVTSREREAPRRRRRG